MSNERSSDMRAAFTGLLVGVVVVVTLMFTIVQLVNRHFAQESSSEVSH